MARRASGRRGERVGWLRLDASLDVVAGGGGSLERMIGTPLGVLIGKRFPGPIALVDSDAIVEVLRGVQSGSAGAVVVAELRHGPSTRWLELSVVATGPVAESGPEELAVDGERYLELRVEDVTARVGEEMRLRSALALERSMTEFAAELARWSDAALDDAIASALERIERSFGAVRASIELAPDSGSAVARKGGAAVGRRLQAPIPGTRPARVLQLAGLDPSRNHEATNLRLARHAELLGAALARRDQGLRARHGEARFRALADHSRDGVCEIDEAARILYASPSFQALHASDGRSLEGLDFLAAVVPEDRRRVAQLLKPGADARRRGSLVYRLQAVDGRVLSIESTARAFAGADGRPRLVVTSRDVTEREQARLALERQIELETRVAELSRYFIDLDVDATDAGITSQLAVVAGLAEAQHSWLYSFTTGHEAPEHFDWWSRFDEERLPVPLGETVERFPYSTARIRRGQIYHVPRIDALPSEASNERADLLRRGVRSLLGIPIMSGGRFVGFLGFESYEREIAWSEETIMLLRLVGEIFYSCLRRRRTVEDLRASESQLLQAQKMEAVGTLAGGIAHDFNNHLAVMLGNARFLKQEVGARPDVLASIEDLERSADHCAKLTRSLLAFSRRSPVQIVPVGVEDVVRGVESLVKPLLPAGIVLATDLPDGLGEFAVDPVQIQQVLVNLLVNARDAMPSGGSIRITADRRKPAGGESAIEGLDVRRDYVVLSVVDRGCGMDGATLRRVFEPFFTTKPVGQGTGLGLAMAYGIVRQSGGAIAIESEPGLGTTVRVFLPSLEDASGERAFAGADGDGQGIAPGFGRRVVVQLAEVGLRERICEGLRGRGFAVEVAASPERVAERVRRASASVDLIVAGTSWPVPSVDRFVEAVRGGATGPAVLAIVLGAGERSAPLDRGVDPRVRVLTERVSDDEILRTALELVGP